MGFAEKGEGERGYRLNMRLGGYVALTSAE
jgi:hypothetical protein